MGTQLGRGLQASASSAKAQPHSSNVGVGVGVQSRKAGAQSQKIQKVLSLFVVSRYTGHLNFPFLYEGCCLCCCGACGGILACVLGIIPRDRGVMPETELLQGRGSATESDPQSLCFILFFGGDHIHSVQRLHMAVFLGTL